MDYRLTELCEQVTTARASYRPIEILGGASKRFYGNRPQLSDSNAFMLQMRGLDGVIHYEPSELVLTAWAGTRIREIEALLHEHNQMLAFDPPCFNQDSTLGGAVAAGLSGPSSFGYGPLRHFVLGTRLLDAQGRVLRFGGEVMKNVAGYDVSRLLAGSLGMFGAIVEVSIKVLPRPEHDLTCALNVSEQAALAICKGFRSSAWPVKAAAWLPDSETHASGDSDNVNVSGTLCVRLAGAQVAVEHARQALGGELLDVDRARQWWSDFREQTHVFFAQKPLWRVAVRAGTPTLDMGPCAFDLAGEVRWLASGQDANLIRTAALNAGGHATLFRHDQTTLMPSDGVFQPLQPTLHGVVRRLKDEFDPKRIFNPGRLVLDL